MKLSKKKVWKRVMLLKGETLHTYVGNESNTIIQVENTNTRKDRVLIDERETFPIREDIEAAYELMIIQGKLKRTDLVWLAHPGKLVSSIVFRIVGEIANDHTQVDFSKKEPVIILNT
jgi:hypothetical protein